MKRGYVVIGICAALCMVLLALMNLIHGNLNQDEGWYLYAAQMVHGGATPYADFAYTQAPLLPYVYSLFLPVVDAFGVAGGRLITTLFGILSGALAAATAARMVDRHKWFAALAAWMLVACNVYQSYFTTVVKTYGLCAFLLMAGLFTLTYRKGWAVLLGGVFLALAAATRLSVGIVLPIAGIWLILQRERRWHWIWFGVGGGVTLLALFMPFFIGAYEQTMFGLLGYHAGRDPGGIKALLMLKMGFVSRFVQAYLIFTLLTLVAVCWRLKERKNESGAVLLWGCGIGISLVHLIAAFPYDDYQTVAYPVLAAALVLTLVPRIDERWHLPALSFLLLASVATAFSSPINQDWFIRGRDRIWWNFKEQSDLAGLRNAAELIRQVAPEGSTLLTQDTYLAVESGCSVPSGMEMGPFCYYPEMPRDRAEKLHLLNREMLLEILGTCDASVAAFSGYGLAIESPAITPVSELEAERFSAVVKSRYALLESIPYFGQAHTTLDIYKRKDAE